MMVAGALALTGLAVDRLLLGGGPQAASAASPPAVVPAGASEAASGGRARAGPAAEGGLARDLAAVRSRLNDLAISPAEPDGLRLPAAWAAELQPPAAAASRPAEAEVREPVTLPKLAAIVRGGDGSRARLDDRFLRVGESIRGLTVIDISDRAVTLRDRAGEEHTVPLPR